MDNWLNNPLIMQTKHGNLEGTIKYGVRLPIRPATTPLRECELGSKEKIEGEKPAYWFVNDDKAIKVRLLTKKVEEHVISGLGEDIKIFRYTIRRKSK